MSNRIYKIVVLMALVSAGLMLWLMAFVVAHAQGVDYSVKQPARYRVTTIPAPEARVMYRMLTVPNLYSTGDERQPLPAMKRLIVEYPRNVPNKTKASAPVFVDENGGMYCTPEGWGVLVAACEVQP